MSQLNIYQIKSYGRHSQGLNDFSFINITFILLQNARLALTMFINWISVIVFNIVSISFFHSIVEIKSFIVLTPNKTVLCENHWRITSSLSSRFPALKQSRWWLQAPMEINSTWRISFEVMVGQFMTVLWWGDIHNNSAMKECNFLS